MKQPSRPVDGTGASDPEWDAAHVVPVAALSRRRFLGAFGASVASLGVEACSKPDREDIVPYVRRPPEVTPGVPRFYATSTTRQGYGFGLLAESHVGRPTKVEGHPKHPASLGATSAREQASVLTLYDPDRARTFLHGQAPKSFHDFVYAAGPESGAPLVPPKGAGLALLLEPTSSPLVTALLDRVRERHPGVSVHYFAPCSAVDRWEGSKRAFGSVYEPEFRFDRAEVVLALDADFLANQPMSVAWARAFMSQRRLEHPTDRMNRLYVVESGVTVTGSVADHRLAIPASHTGAAAAALFALVHDLSGAGASPARAAADRFLASAPHRPFLEALARDLVKHKGRVAVVVGDRQPPEVHALGHALNAALGAFGTTVGFTRSPIAEAGTDAHRIEPLLHALDGGAVETLFVLGGNPAYYLPRDARWHERARKARERVLLSLYRNETSADATWFLPATHYLEQWGDCRAYDGTVSFIQPLIRPLYGGKSVEEVLAVLLGDPDPDARSLLEDFWTKRPGGSHVTHLSDALQEGLLPGTAESPVNAVTLNQDEVARAIAALSLPHAGIEVDVAPDPRMGAGDLSNNAWLQELPEPITKTVWGNAALVAPSLAERMDLETGDVVALRSGELSVKLPVFVQPGHAPDAVTVWLGYGRGGSESVAAGVGVDVSPLRSLDAPWTIQGARLEKTGESELVVQTQTETRQHDRPLYLRRTLDEWAKEPGFAEEHDVPPTTILPNRLTGSPQWGMAIDLNVCTGCSACVIACQAENNIPVVGKSGVHLRREMHWLRIDRYYEGTDDDPRIDLQPMLCQHCEKAPCEYVCPVNATVHSPDGLNEMVYNRCVGTRFCSNNCPYKVRRFNFFKYTNEPPETVRMVMNPDVTVRGRGVMEKCTYCVQRIREAEIHARIEGRPVRDGEVMTACQQACPPRAIEFGLVSDPQSPVSKWRANARTYGVLNDQGTYPRTRYLARISNPNPELES
jgi:molybdopterin-containing oxidoreductase family iron-sulfur binding subunit